MSFLKIKDPKKREVLVNEYLKLKNKIKTDDFNEKIEESDRSHQLSEFFKPVTTSTKQLTEQLSTMIPPREEKYLAIEGPITEDPPGMILGDIAEKYLGSYLPRFDGRARKNVDLIYGVTRKENGRLFIGDHPFTVDKNDIIIHNKRYEGTEGLWRLITMKNPTNYSETDLENYVKIVIDSDLLTDKRRGTQYPRSNRGSKWRFILRPIWDEQKEMQQGSNITFLPRDLTSLLKRLELLLASREAGNTGLENEMVSICNELHRQNKITNDEYKKMIFHINKT